jgi:glucokinase
MIKIEIEMVENKISRTEVIGVDMGGTNIRVARIANEKIVDEASCHTPDTTDDKEVVDALIGLIRKVLSPATEAVGIGIPSVVDTENGIVYDVMNIPSWKEVHLKSILETEFNFPVYINNDANCFAIGEKIYGVGQSFNHFVGLTLGTGLGAGIIQDGRLLKDANCGSGEFCVVPYLDSNYEDYCSGMYFKKMNKDGKDIFKKAQEGDPEALKLLKSLGAHLGQLVKLVMATIDPEMIVFGGSVAKAFPYFKDAMVNSIQDFAYPNSVKKLQIKVSEIENQAVFGAAALCY